MEESENAIYWRELMNKDGHIEILEKNVYELQEQLQNAYKRISELIDELDSIEAKKSLN